MFDQPHRQRIIARLSDEQRQDVDTIAEHDGVAVSTVIRSAIATYAEQHPATRPKRAERQQTDNLMP